MPAAEGRARVAVLGTELAPLRPESGALERVVLAWSRAPGLEAAGVEVVPVGAGGGPDDWTTRLRELAPDLVVLNNRPLWAELVPAGARVLHVLHNYPDAWGARPEDAGRLRAALEDGAVAAVSPSLARDVAARFDLTGAVRVVWAGVEPCHFEVSWHGRGGPVLFPSRILEKKGVRLFLDVARRLEALGRHCVMSRHLAPFPEPTPEQGALLAAIDAAGCVELAEPPASRRGVAEWYASAGVVVCPSIHPEGLGLAALEAQAVGAPLVTSGLGGLADATFPPNETVGDLRPDPWCAAVLRAEGRPPAPGPSRMVRERHGEVAAGRSWLEAVRAALATG